MNMEKRTENAPVFGIPEHRKILDGSALKILAAIIMIVDHTWWRALYIPAA